MGSAQTLVIVPTLNERENIERLLPAIRAEVPEAHVLVVDDNSPDGTADRVEAMAARDGSIHLSRRTGPPGLGPAYLHGFQWGLERGYAHLFEMDADFSHQPRYLPRFLDAIAQADLVLGCRYISGGGVVGWGPLRQLISRGGNLYAQGLLGLPYRDLTGGFKCFRREVLEAIDLRSVQSVGYAFQIELTWRAARAGFRITELPIVFPDRIAGSSKMSARIIGEAARNVWRMSHQGFRSGTA